VEAGHRDEIPEALKKSPALRALYHNLEKPAAQSPDHPDEEDEKIAEDPAEIRFSRWRGGSTRR